MMKIKFTSVLFAILLLLAFFSGCSSSQNEPNDNSLDAEAVMKLDATLSEAYLYTDTVETLEGKLSQQLYNMITYQVINSEAGFYEIEIAYPDLGNYLLSDNLDNIDFTSEEFVKSILSVLESGNLEMKTEVIKVELVDGKPVVNDALTNAYSGGLLSALADAINQEMMKHIEQVMEE